MRYLKLQVLLLLLAVVAVGATGADVVLKNRAETELATRISERVPDTTGVRVRIRSFPFVGRLLVSQKVSLVDVDVQHSSAGGLALADIRVRVEEVEMDRDAAMDGRAVVNSIERGSVQADLRQEEINRRLPRGFQVQMGQGTATVSGPGGAEAKLAVTPQGQIQLRLANRALLDLPLPETALLPCRPEATFVPGSLRLVCTFDEVPPLLLDLAQR